MRKALWVVGLVGLVAPAAWAQVTTNPTVVEFTASADHDVIMGDGRPMVQEYRFEIWAQGAQAPMSTTSLGKPDVVGPGNRISTSPAVLLGIPVGQVFVATVTAIGPTGEGRSNPSNPFERRAAPAAPGNVTLRAVTGPA